MLTISKTQMQTFEKVEIEKFVQLCFFFLEENCSLWYEDKEEKEIRSFIYDAIAFGKQYEIEQENNIQKLMYFKIVFAEGFERYEREYLKGINVNENYRVKQLYKKLNK